jgi:hypothetical protein
MKIVRKPHPGSDTQRYGWLRSPVWLLAVVPIVFVLMLGVFRATKAFLGWPETERERDVAMLVALGVAAFPLLQFASSQVFPFLSKNRAQVEASAGWASLKLDFSQATVAVIEASSPSQVRVPDNIIGTSLLVTEHMDMIMRAVQDATASPINIVNLGGGREWYLTRLFALAAGAHQYGSPEAFVFVVTKAKVTGTFLGWAESRSVFKVLLRSDLDYAKEYYAALSIYEQLLSSYEPRRVQSVPGHDRSLQMSPTETQYSHLFDPNPEYAFMAILMDRLQRLEAEPRVWLTPSLLADRLGPVLFTKMLDLAEPIGQQIDAMVEAPEQYVPVARDGRFLGLAKVDRIVSMLVKQLALNSELSLDGTMPIRESR